MKYYETAKFKALNKKWKKKLEKSGFEDAEQDINPKLCAQSNIKEHEISKLKAWTTSLFKGRYSEVGYKAKEAYYQLAGQFLHSYDFETKKEQVVWMHHSNGLSYDKIVSATKITHAVVRRIVEKLSAIMLERRNSDEHE